MEHSGTRRGDVIRAKLGWIFSLPLLLTRSLAPYIEVPFRAFLSPKTLRSSLPGRERKADRDKFTAIFPRQRERASSSSSSSITFWLPAPVTKLFHSGEGENLSNDVSSDRISHAIMEGINHG